MIVYRVEHTTAVDDRTHHACGPMGDVSRFADTRKRDEYDLACEAQEAVCRAMNGHAGKPTPFWDEKLQGINHDEICGVDSMENVKFWFEDALPALERAGFTVRKYDVPKWACRVGESGQVLFKYQFAELIDNEEKAHE